MSIQPITRQALVKKMAAVVNQLPTEKLVQLWQQVDAWETALAQPDNDKNRPNGGDGQAVVEFVVPHGWMGGSH